LHEDIEGGVFYTKKGLCVQGKNICFIIYIWYIYTLGQGGV